mmetsp:Transcript_23220/g.59644  ORF Transcript_23220/g.59644 Transcript_23220/m.59644 type:complete len:125 (+) Transcript_23220:21-395(+)
MLGAVRQHWASWVALCTQGSPVPTPATSWELLPSRAVAHCVPEPEVDASQDTGAAVGGCTGRVRDILMAVGVRLMTGCCMIACVQAPGRGAGHCCLCRLLQFEPAAKGGIRCTVQVFVCGEEVL